MVVLQLLQQQVRDKAKQAGPTLTSSNGSYVEDLQLQAVLGQGGFGTVYSGLWKGSLSAIKVSHVHVMCHVGHA
jgi:predicted Ser/Thr protein kinase